MPNESVALEDISFEVDDGEFLGIIGHTGSGKSTLLQHLNGLLKPDEGKIIIGGVDITADDVSMVEIRKRIGLVFQYPEYQLFEETVLKDISFGPKNLGFDQHTCEEKARKAMELVGIAPDLEDASPFALSGGQKRRVALAGILAMEPEYLILDEPVAGLDGTGKDNLFSLLRYLNEEKKITILLVSHDMDDVAANARRVLVMNHGELIMDDTTEKVFSREKELKTIGLAIPQALQFYNSLKSGGYFKNVSETWNKKKTVETAQAERNGKTAQAERNGKTPLTVEELAIRILEENRCFEK